jgi:hypothetical protein
VTAAAWCWSPAATSWPAWSPRDGAHRLTLDVLSPGESINFARYGTWRQVVTGNYVQSKHECVTWNYETVTSGQVTAHLVLADDPVGWYLWE